MITPEEFVKDFGNPKEKQEIYFGKIDPAYSAGRPKVVYDTDILTNTLSKALPYLGSYVPAANDRVMIVKGVIIGKII